MDISFKDFTERIALEYEQLNVLEKKINQFFNSFRVIFDNQPASQLTAYLLSQNNKFKIDKEKLIVKQTEVDALKPKQINGNQRRTNVVIYIYDVICFNIGQPDPVARERRRELYSKLDFLDTKLGSILKMQLHGFKKGNNNLISTRLADIGLISQNFNRKSWMGTSQRQFRF